ncbi:membrane protein DedA, SNARE-associated domain [Paracoccus isoporae]|uniref:Membrane protein DedA, SNARE-associated domain n=1 Tax=Paracoccus isoporae TaxID=591205 RepID=A0A1G7EP17_9RHOB|nr:DedA family protein [Paracoccus isoporae]SDE65125.1 membrane protein DedA, SNARE-associated domain [Paracoccus isoporae]
MFEWVVSVIEGWGYPGVFLLMLAENVFPPIPSEVIMPLAGYLVGEGELDLTLTIIAGTAGSVLGTSLWYLVGQVFGAPRLKRWAARWGRVLTMSPSDIDGAIGWFDRHGRAAVFFGRMLPAIRTLISVPAGIARMKFWRFLLLTIAGSAIWTVLLTVAGLILQDQFERVSAFIDPVSKLIVLSVVVIYVYRVITWKPH